MRIQTLQNNLFTWGEIADYILFWEIRKAPRVFWLPTGKKKCMMIEILIFWSLKEVGTSTWFSLKIALRESHYEGTVVGRHSSARVRTVEFDGQLGGQKINNAVRRILNNSHMAWDGDRLGYSLQNSTDLNMWSGILVFSLKEKSILAFKECKTEMVCLRSALGLEFVKAFWICLD